MWFENYLKNRSLVAKVTTSPNKTIKSDRFDITYRTAQGSCIGPLLFIIFVNDIHLLPIYSKIILFADDTTIFNSHTSNKYLRFMLEHDLSLKTDWFNANKLSLNLYKTVAMQFWNNNANLELRVDDLKIPLVECTKFLGVLIDSQLMWHDHVNHLVNKLSNNKRLMSLGKHLLDKNSLCNVYFAHTKVYLKCRVPGCSMTYVIFNTMRNMTAHHRLHHPAITYKCSSCAKIVPTPNSLRLHMYYHRNKQYKCNICDQSFVYQSKLKQHKRRHIKLKMYQCFHRGCNQKYRHPQDLTRHIKSHQKKSFECDFCDKKFAEKRLLERHLAVHQNINVYTCEKCGQGFKHNNQLYRHRKKCA